MVQCTLLATAAAAAAAPTAVTAPWLRLRRLLLHRARRVERTAARTSTYAYGLSWIPASSSARARAASRPNWASIASDLLSFTPTVAAQAAPLSASPLPWIAPRCLHSHLCLRLRCRCCRSLERAALRMEAALGETAQAPAARHPKPVAACVPFLSQPAAPAPRAFVLLRRRPLPAPHNHCAHTRLMALARQRDSSSLYLCSRQHQQHQPLNMPFVRRRQPRTPFPYHQTLAEVLLRGGPVGEQAPGAATRPVPGKPQAAS